MKKIIPRLLIAIIIAYAIHVAYPYIDTRESFDHIEWQGQQFQLDQRYADWDDYHHASHQIIPKESPRILALMRAIPVPQHFNNREDMIGKVSDLQFPGYGEMITRDIGGEDGNTYNLMQYEIPEAAKTRSLLFRTEKDNSYTLVMDRILPELDFENHPEYLTSLEIRIENRHLRIYQGKTILLDGEFQANT